MSWLSLCLDSADRQISGGNACDDIRASAAVAPICQSRRMRAGRPTVLQIMPVLVSSPLSPFSNLILLLFRTASSIMLGNRKVEHFPLSTYNTGKLHFLLETHCVCLKGHIMVLHYVFYKKWGSIAPLFRHLCSSNCYLNESIILCTIFLWLRQTKISGDWMSVWWERHIASFSLAAAAQ